MEERVKGIMAEILDLQVEKINEDTSPDTVKDWDSLKHMQLILSLEEEFNIEIPDEKIDEMLSLKKIIVVLQKMLV